MEGFNQQATQPTSLKRDRTEEEEYVLPAKRLADESDLTLGNPYMDDNETVSEKYPIPESAVGIVIGRSGSEIQGIQAKAGCRVQMSSEQDNSGVRMVSLEGNRSNVETAKILINEVVARAQAPRPQYGFPRAQATIDIPIPPNRCGLIIGKSGDTIRQLQEKSGCKMVLVQENQAVSDQAKPLRITGDPQKIEVAKQLVAEILNSGNDGNAAGGMQTQHALGGASARGEVVVPRSSVGIIIGKQGETIKRLAMETGTKIQFKPDDNPSIPERCAIIMGTRDQIFRATERITELVKKSAMQQGGGSAGGGMISNDSSTFYMSVPAAKCGLVIGKGGETIKQINSESGAHCELSREPTGNADEKVFVIKGGKRSIEHAKHLIRIKVGDIPPNTPFRDDSLMSIQPQFSAPAQNGFGGQQQWNPAATQMTATAQNPYQVGGWQQNNVYAQQPATAPSAPYAAAGIVPAQPQVAYQQPQVVQQAQPTVAAAAAATPGVDPVTGEQDYSAQWMEYYKSIGAHDKAEAVEAQMKKKKAEAAARAAGSVGLIQQIPMGISIPQIAGQARVPTQAYPAYSAAAVIVICSDLLKLSLQLDCSAIPDNAQVANATVYIPNNSQVPVAISVNFNCSYTIKPPKSVYAQITIANGLAGINDSITVADGQQKITKINRFSPMNNVFYVFPQTITSVHVQNFNASSKFQVTVVYKSLPDPVYSGLETGQSLSHYTLNTVQEKPITFISSSSITLILARSGYVNDVFDNYFLIDGDWNNPISIQRLADFQTANFQSTGNSLSIVGLDTKLSHSSFILIPSLELNGFSKISGVTVDGTLPNVHVTASNGRKVGVILVAKDAQNLVLHKMITGEESSCKVSAVTGPPNSNSKMLMDFKTDQFTLPQLFPYPYFSIVVENCEVYFNATTYLPANYYEMDGDRSGFVFSPIFFNYEATNGYTNITFKYSGNLTSQFTVDVDQLELALSNSQLDIDILDKDLKKTLSTVMTGDQKGVTSRAYGSYLNIRMNGYVSAKLHWTLTSFSESSLKLHVIIFIFMAALISRR